MSRVNTGFGGNYTKPTPIADETGYHVYHDATSDWLFSESLINTIAVISNTDPTKTPIPLTDVVDTDALDVIFADTHDSRERNEGYVVFTISDLDVFAHANGHMFIRERTTDDT